MHMLAYKCIYLVCFPCVTFIFFSLSTIHKSTLTESLYNFLSLPDSTHNWMFETSSMIHESINQSINTSFIHLSSLFIYIVFSFSLFVALHLFFSLSIHQQLWLFLFLIFLSLSLVASLCPFTSVTGAFIVSMCQLTDFQMKWRKYFDLCLNVRLAFSSLSSTPLLVRIHLPVYTSHLFHLNPWLLCVFLCLAFSPFSCTWMCFTWQALSHASSDQLNCLHVTSDHETSYSKILLDRWTDSRDIATLSK